MATRYCIGLALLLGVATATCKKDATVVVGCTPGDKAVDCKLEHLEGDAPVNVCWTTNIECSTVTNYVDEQCRDVAALQKVEARLDLSHDPKFRNCEKVLEARVQNIKTR